MTAQGTLVIRDWPSRSRPFFPRDAAIRTIVSMRFISCVMPAGEPERCV
jgi:hypothetical protein